MQGKWEVYKDGLLADTGCGLSEGGRVKKGGLLVIGQEQDEPGGRFSAAESFHGRITRLDIWSRALQQQQVLELKTQCDYYYGDLLTWPDVYTGLRGQIKVCKYKPSQPPKCEKGLKLRYSSFPFMTASKI